MTGQQAVRLIDLLLDREQQRKLNDLESTIVLQAWDGISYRDTADLLSYELDYIKHIAARLWKLLSKLLGESICKSNLRSVLDRVLASSQIADNGGSQHDRIDDRHGTKVNFQNLEIWVINDRFEAIGFFGAEETQARLGQKQVQTEIQSLIWQNFSKPMTPNVLMAEILSVLEVKDPQPNSVNCLIVNCYF